MEMKQLEKVEFEVDGGLVIADPCYLDEGISKNGRFGVVYVPDGSGKWTGTVEYSDEGEWGERVSHLRAERKNAMPTIRYEQIGPLGVDSGQMSIIPADRTPLDYDGLCAEHNKYDYHAQILDYGGGIVSSTGFGDGVYYGTLEYDSTGLSKITVQFIWEEDEYEDEE